MHQIRIAISGNAYAEKLPSSWQELSLRQFRMVFRILYTSIHPGKLRVSLLGKLLFRELGWWKRKTLHYRLIRLAKTEVLWELSECVSFLWKEACSIAFLPHFWHRFRRYHLPGDHFRNGSLIEFIFADALLQHIVTEDKVNEDLLTELVAVLCRPAKPFWFVRKRVAEWNTGDPRQRFNSALLAQRKKRLASLPMHYKLYVLRYFVGCKLHVLESYPLLFPKPSGNKQINESAQGGSWIELLKDIADTKLYGNYDDTAHYNLHTILTNANNDLRNAAIKKKK